jgi:hypothetical protein
MFRSLMFSPVRRALAVRYCADGMRIECRACGAVVKIEPRKPGAIGTTTLEHFDGCRVLAHVERLQRRGGQ